MNSKTDFYRHPLLPGGSRILAAVSGGADSVYLLHRLLESAPRAGWSLGVAHFNHRLRGEESERDAAFVQALAEQFELPFYLGSEDTADYAARRKLGLEEAARELRYAFLRRAAEEGGYDRVATAHTADDNAETVLLNLVRGSGARGLSGIPPVRGIVVRPILDVTEEEIRAWLGERDIPHVEDSTNAADDTARNRLRHCVTPVLKSINPRYAAHILRAGEFLRGDDELLTAMAEDFLGRRGLSASAIAALPKPVAVRVLALAAGQPLQAAHLLSLLALCESGDPFAGVDLPGLRAAREYDALIFSPPEVRGFSERPLEIGGVTEIPELGLRVRAEKQVQCAEINNNFKIFFFQYEKVCGKLSVRPRAPGDRVRLPGRGCQKSLKKLFSEKKLTLAQRARVPVLADERGVLGVYGFGPDTAVLAEPGAPALKVEFF